MCSHPIEHEAQLSRAMPRASARSSAARRGASEKVAAWKLRVGSVAIALKARRLASVPSSRYFAVAGPNERVRRSRAASSTARGSCEGTFVAGLTAIALSSFAPSTAPRPPRPAWRPSWGTRADRAPRPPARADHAARAPAAGGGAVGGAGRVRARALAGGADRRAPPGLAEPFAQALLGVRGGQAPQVAGRLEPRAVAVDEQHRRLGARAADDDRVVPGQLARDREVARGERGVEHPRQRRTRHDGEIRARRQRRADERREAERERGVGRKRIDARGREAVHEPCAEARSADVRAQDVLGQGQRLGARVREVDDEGAAEVAARWAGRLHVPTGYARRRPGPAGSAARVGGEERDGVARRERRLGIARDLVAVERRDDVLVEGQAAGGRRLAERRGAKARGGGDAVAGAAERPEALDGDFGSGAAAGGVIVAGLVEV